jgi:drug/metabolite transporter (DMT)-like permease
MVIKMNNKQKGTIYIITSAFFFAMMSMFVRLSGDLPSIQKSFFRNIVAMIVAAVILIKNNEGFSYKKKDIPLLTLRALFGTIGVLGNFYAVDHLLLADASILQKMNPFFVIIFSYFILTEKITIKQILMICIAFIGALFVVKPTFQNVQLLASLIAVIGAACAGLAYTLVRLLSERGVEKSKIVFFFSAFSCAILLPYLIFNYQPMSLLQFIYLLLAGLMAAGGQFAITTAYSYAPGKEISIFDYSQIIFSAIAGLFVFSQVPDLMSVIGYMIIFVVAFMNYRYNLKQ